MADLVQLSLPTFVVAPDATGRGYEFNTRADWRDRWTVDLPMVMLAWSQLNIPEPFACCIDFDDGLAVCRGQFLRKLASGNSIALLSGVVISNAQCAKINWRTDLLAASIPLPDENTQFAARPHLFDFGRDKGAQKTWPSDALSWGKRSLRYDDDCDAQAVLTKFFETIEPKGQRAWFRCWTTTDTLPAKGGLDFGSQAQLMLSSSSQKKGPPFLDAKVSSVVTESGEAELSISEIEASNAPLGYQAFAQTLGLAEQHIRSSTKISLPGWSLKRANSTPASISIGVASHILKQLDLNQAYPFLAAMLEHSNSAVRKAGQTAVMNVLEHLNKIRAWDADTCQIIAKLPDKEPVFALLLSGKELKYYNTKLLEELAKIAGPILREGAQSGQENRSLTVFAIEYVRFTKTMSLPVDSAMGLVQCLRGNPDVAELTDVLTPTTVNIYSDYEGRHLSDLTADLMGADFFDLQSVSSSSNAINRISAAFAAVTRMAG